MAASYEEIRVTLEKHRAALEAELAELSALPDTGMGYSNHQADQASDAFEQAADLAMRQNAERLLYQVERALQRIAAGTYGTCRNCGSPIAPERLKAIPYTRYCFNCASQHPE
jgi:RNA polymerase-binding protein DksA